MKNMTETAKQWADEITDFWAADMASGAQDAPIEREDVAQEVRERVLDEPLDWRQEMLLGTEALIEMVWQNMSHKTYNAIIFDINDEMIEFENLTSLLDLRTQIEETNAEIFEDWDGEPNPNAESYRKALDEYKGEANFAKRIWLDRGSEVLWITSKAN